MKTKTILAVDDVELNLDIIDSFLDKYNIIKSKNGFEALEIAKEQDIDLIILDIVMPDIDGFEVCQRLKEEEKTKNIPILFITASTDEKKIEKAYEVGGVDYITKPFKPKELLARVSTQLELADKTYNLENLISNQLEQLRDKDTLILNQSKKVEMGQMIATIAHQLKQPLNVISAAISVILLNDMLDKKIDIQKLGHKVQDEIKFMSETIDMYRTFFSTNKEKQSVFLEKIVEDTLNILTGNILDIRFIKDYQKDLDKIEIYPNEIIQCMMNIIKNAQDAQDDKKIKEKVIKISIYDEDEYQVVTIHDNAGGIPNDIKDRIFENYFTTKSEENGTGIGLHLVKQIIEDKHNGEVFVENDELKYAGKSVIGAKFIIKLKKKI